MEHAEGIRPEWSLLTDTAALTLETGKVVLREYRVAV